MTDEQTLLRAANAAAVTIEAIYQWVDRVEEAGGTTTLSGISACHAMLASLRMNKPRLDKLVMKPLVALVAGEAPATTSADMKEARDCIGDLLKRIDDYAGEGMHFQGQTPDWYVRAALICCGLPTQTTEGD